MLKRIGDVSLQSVYQAPDEQAIEVPFDYICGILYLLKPT